MRQIRGNVGYAQPPHLFLNDGQGGFHDIAAGAGAGFATPKVARGLAYGDFDRDGDLDLLITTNQGPALSVSQRRRQRLPLAALRLTGSQIESRRHRRRGARLHARRNAIAHGEDRIELPVAIRVDAHLRPGQAGQRASAW